MLACLCWGGWFDVWDDTVGECRFPIYGGCPFGGGLWMVMSRKFIWLFDSVSAVNVILGWSILKSSCMFLMSEWRDS